MMADVELIQIVVAHSERATLRVGDMFLKIDTDQARTDVEVQAMVMAPVPTPEILWRRPPVLALAALPGQALGRLQEPSTASPAAWAAAGASIRTLHDAPLPPRPGRSLDELASRLAAECDWLVANDVLPVDVVTRNRRLAETVLRPWTEVFVHGDLQITHVFVEDDEVTGGSPPTSTSTDPRVVVISKPDRDQVAGRERLRLAGDVSRGRRPAITAVRLREPPAGHYRALTCRMRPQRSTILCMASG
jgi:hypothetical protein